MSDLIQRNNLLRRIGVNPKGRTGCSMCDLRDLYVCQCPPAVDECEIEAFLEELEFENQSPAVEAHKKPQTRQEYDEDTSKNSLRKTPELKFNFEYVKLTREDKELLEEILEAINQNFSEFKKELTAKGLSVKDYLARFAGRNSLYLSIPNGYLRNLFLRHLLNNHLLFDPSLDLDAENRNQDEGKNRSSMTPFKLKCLPKGA